MQASVWLQTVGLLSRDTGPEAEVLRCNESGHDAVARCMPFPCACCSFVTSWLCHAQALDRAYPKHSHYCWTLSPNQAAVLSTIHPSRIALCKQELMNNSLYTSISGRYENDLIHRAVLAAARNPENGLAVLAVILDRRPEAIMDR